MSGINDSASVGLLPGQKRRDLIQWFLCGRQPDFYRSSLNQPFEAGNGQTEMSASLVSGECMNFIDNQACRGLQHASPGIRSQQQVKRFRRCYQNMRRFSSHFLALGLCRISSSNRSSDLKIRGCQFSKTFSNSVQRRFKIALDIVRERF